MNDHFLFKLHSNCILAKGAGRSLICDLQRRRYIPVPNSLAALVDEKGIIHCPLLREQLDEEGAAIFEEYLDFLTDKDLGFFCTEKEAEHFPAISTEWDYAGLITNCILDVRDSLDYFGPGLLQQLSRLGCYYIQLRFFTGCSIACFEQVLDLIRLSDIKAAEFIISADKTGEFQSRLPEIVAGNKKVRSVLLHSAEHDEIIRRPVNDFGLIHTTRETICSEKHCGIVAAAYFQSSVEHFTESLHHNTCLNRKISIDKAGNIKNCPSLPESFGNIKDTRLAEAIAMPGFKKYWNIAKDQVSICRDCEFRHICTDCRAYVERPEDDYSKPLKCGYDPYTCTWEDWSTHPLKQAAIAYYQLRKHEKDQGSMW